MEGLTTAARLPSDVPRDLYPFEGRFFDRDGLAYHYLDEGEGPAVVMVHGNPTWSFYYRQLVQALSPTHRCLVPDHIGCGLSDKPSADAYPYTLEARADDLEAWLDAVCPDGPVTLVLHDWGGMIGMLWAHRHPQRVKRIVLLNTAAFHLPKTKRFPPALRLARDSKFGGHLVTQFNAFAGVAARIGCTQSPMPAALRRAYVAPYDTPDNRVATLRFVQDIPLAPEDPGYATVTAVEEGLSRWADTPVFIGWGLRDFVFDGHFLRRWEELLSHAEIHRWEQAGHYVLEDVYDELLPRLTAFLDRHPI